MEHSAQTSQLSAMTPGVPRRARGWGAGLKVLDAIRRYQRYRHRPTLGTRLLAVAAVAEHRVWSALAGVDIPLECRIDGALRLPHPNGIVIHPDAVIGYGCTIYQQVTIGVGPRPGAPKLGARVEVGAGAKVLGGVHIGDYARIGPNAVVTHDVPPGATVLGMPGQIVHVEVSGESEVADLLRGSADGRDPELGLN